MSNTFSCVQPVVIVGLNPGLSKSRKTNLWK